jgi:hypothetical protein
MPSPTHARCPKTHPQRPNLVCHKSPEHTQHKDPARRVHYDSSEDEHWSDELNS